MDHDQGLAHAVLMTPVLGARGAVAGVAQVGAAHVGVQRLVRAPEAQQFDPAVQLSQAVSRSDLERDAGRRRREHGAGVPFIGELGVALEPAHLGAGVEQERARHHHACQRRGEHRAQRVIAEHRTVVAKTRTDGHLGRQDVGPTRGAGRRSIVIVIDESTVQPSKLNQSSAPSLS